MSDDIITRPPLPEPPEGLNEAWPAPDYRTGQKAIFQEAATALFGDNKFDTVIIDAPTGLGKSVINTGLCNYADSAFYTTPQKELRRQLEEDNLLSGLYEVLRARADYVPCQEALSRTEMVYNCSNCPVNRAKDRYYYDGLDRSKIEGVPESEVPEGAMGVKPVACSNVMQCNYWKAKVSAMRAQTAVVTFAYLIIDSFLMTYQLEDETGNVASQKSFANRDLLVVDEAHSLEGQVASMFAGFQAGENIPHEIRSKISNVVPGSLIKDATEPDYTAPIDDHVIGIEEINGFAEIRKAIHDYIAGVNERIALAQSDEPNTEVLTREDINDLQRLIAQLDSLYNGFERHLGYDYDPDESPWLLSAEQGSEGLIFKFQPVHVDQFLKETVWSRADKIVLSSATIPSYGGLDRKSGAKEWAARLGLDPETTHVIRADSPFPTSNRPIYADNPVGNMSNDGFMGHFDRIVDRIRELAEKHSGQKGLIHTSSYSQAEALADELEDLAICHRSEDPNPKAAIRRWQGEVEAVEDVKDTEKDLLISPALSEGVDLPDDKCRWQVAIKVPFASLGNPRVKYRKNRLNEIDWYLGEAALTMVQAAGRGVRHPEDECMFYVLDSSFSSVRGYTPRWYRDAIV
ncbi:helicase C-terminal domain-containing protein [Halosolutus gelatinilyticus]|uniref:helicase C-terminal domain-containing protein n=1 Tax=Halosolutus gelatinilyticus TaxID=2931975 RepID=UPI001FF50A5B|nr:helicase C-terminal domain-containing protein [Halosolutus gelatinilyticus]